MPAPSESLPFRSMADAPSAAVLLFVGARSAPGEWLHVQQLCFERQIAFCALPLMGHGGHPLHGPGNFLAWPDELTFDAVVDDALRAALGLIQELQRRYGEMPIVLAGHSFGARVMSAVWRQLKDSFPLPFAWLINPALHHRQLRGNAEFAKYQRLATTLQHVLGRSEWFWQNLYTLWHPATVLGGEAQSRGRFRAYLRLHAGFYSALYEGLHDDGVQMPPDALVSVSVDDPQLDLRETLLLCARTPSVTVVPLSGGKHNPQAEENGVATNLVATVVERLALERRLQAPRNRRT